MLPKESAIVTDHNCIVVFHTKANVRANQAE